MLARISNQRGETLAETLVALLLISLGVLMFSTAITTATRMVTRARETAGTYCVSTNGLVSGVSSVTIGGSSSVSITSTGINSPSEIAIVPVGQELPGGITAVTYKQS